MAEFAFVTCLVGAESLLKAELAQRYPSLRPAFMKPGFITLKSDGPLPKKITGTFVQSSGVSVGWDEPAAREKLPSEKAGLCVYGPDIDPAELDGLRQELAASLATAPLEELAPGAPVIDVIVLGDKRWFGTHAFEPQDALHPGVYRPELPPAAPSRAYLKLEETLLHSGAPLEAGDRVVELGVAPGGAAYALLIRGMRVTGIDPAAVDEVVKCNPEFVHIPFSINVLADQKLPPAEWVFSDMNVAPEQTLKAALRLINHCRPRGVFLTMKLKDEKSARFLEADKNDLAQAGYTEVGLRQLPSHRSEVLLYGLNAAAIARRDLRP